MAWTAPATWSVSEVVVASKMNAHIRDNLSYLKGLAGAVTIEDELASIVAAGGSLTAQGTSNASFARLKLLAKTSGGAAIDWRILANGAAAAEFSIFEDAASERFRIAAGGKVGINCISPQGRLHVNDAGGGFMFLSCDAVGGALQTPVVAGTVTQSAAFWIYDRNNTGGGFVQVSGNMLTLGQTFNMVNTDTVAIVVTAGGAITVQRTVGTNGTHQINGFVVFK